MMNFMEVKMNFKGTIIIRQEEEWFVATCRLIFRPVRDGMLVEN
jgi:hypothetical protein